MKIAVVTDSTAYLTEQQVKDHHLFVVPIPVILDGQVYDEGVDITTEEFYQKLKTSETFPSTSQPPLGEMLKLYEDLGNEGYDAVISIHLASTISGFVTTLKNAASTIDNIQVPIRFRDYCDVNGLLSNGSGQNGTRPRSDRRPDYRTP